MEYVSEPLPSRRRKMVDNQKNPLANKPKITWCVSARKAIVAFLNSNCTNESLLDEEIERIQEKIENLDEKNPKKMESKIKKLEVEIEAINSFKGIQKEMELNGLRFSKAPKSKYLNYSGVHVSVRPEVALSTEKSWEYVGCLKLYFKKTKRLNEDSANFLCSVLNHYTEKHLSPSHAANPKACIAVDVFGHRAFTAFKNIPLYTGKIRQSCQEINETWKTIPSRKEIKGDDDNQSEMNFPE
jgi:hypothetical protein